MIPVRMTVARLAQSNHATLGYSTMGDLSIPHPDMNGTIARGEDGTRLTFCNSVINSQKTDPSNLSGLQAFEMLLLATRT